MSVLVLDTIRGFTLGEGTVALALDIKEAFNYLLPSMVLQQLIKKRVLARLINFVAFVIVSRNIVFQESLGSRCYRVGVPQGGVLSLLLFNLALREIHKHLPANVRLLQFADDILLYCRSEDINEALSSLEVAYGN